MRKSFSALNEQEVLALAISLENEDARIYGDFAERLKEDYPETTKILRTMQEEEHRHAQSLTECYQAHFGAHIPFISRTDVKGFINRKPTWLAKVLSLTMVRKEIETMEQDAIRFYEAAARHTKTEGVRELLKRLAEAEQTHEHMAGEMVDDLKRSGGLQRENDSQQRRFVLQVVQPGLAGLMDGSVSTLAPVFAAAFATHNSWDAFLVGMAASIGAGISMGFAEALSDDGVISGRGRPYIRGVVCGLMTTVGGVGHTLPYLIGNFHLATTVAVAVVAAELAAISWIRHRYMDTPLLSAAFQVVVGGVLVFLTGILIGSAS